MLVFTVHSYRATSLCTKLTQRILAENSLVLWAQRKYDELNLKIFIINKRVLVASCPDRPDVTKTYYTWLFRLNF